MTRYECDVCGWSGEEPKEAGRIDLCPDCLATGLEENGDADADGEDQ